MGFDSSIHRSASVGAGRGLCLQLCLLLSLLPFSISVLLPTLSPPTNSTSYYDLTFPYFGKSFTNLTVLNDASIAPNGALQITMDTSNTANYLVNNSGRILYSDPFLLWEELKSVDANSTKKVASFSTVFIINVYRTTNTSIPGEGITFLIAPSKDPLPLNSYGGFLGLTNSTLNGLPSNKFVAIEFDTVKQDYDPDDNHVGLNINGVHSNATNSLTPFGIEIAPLQNNSANYTVWIEYNGSTRHIWVYMTFEGQPKPTKDVLNASIDLSEIVNQNSYLGFSASTGTLYELNCVLAWSLMVEKLDKEGLSKWKLGLIIGLPLLFFASVVSILLAIYIKRKKVRDDPNDLKGTLRSLPGTPREFDFRELKKATDNFTTKLGQGGFGVVYKGVLVGDDGKDMLVAVKKFSRANSKGQDDFLQELSIINRLRHRNLVRLVGWCYKNGGLLLVYDFMPNGSLDQHLFCGPEKPILNWDRRYNIIIDVASALNYLHNEYDQMVVHRDLKASNVMLDQAFNARLGDFGLARALESDKTSYAELGGIQGTMGYIAPECFHTGKATRESDIYGFGAVILETVTGRRPKCEIAGFHFLVDYVWKLYREGRILESVDPRLSAEFDELQAERLLRLGLMCSHPTPSARPKTQAVVQILNGSVPPPAVPHFKPAFVMPAPEPDEDDGNSSRLISTGVTSSYTVSSGGWTSGSIYASRELKEMKSDTV
ncbi:hypothetical protein LUZ60_000070 [Juncus effusus]|nr:hypothetical protein LUZ60_000070 [Juncus effusus]